jgi:PIF1-like helicase
VIPEADFVQFVQLDLVSGERDPNAQQYYERNIVTITNKHHDGFDTLQECLDQGTGVVPGAGGNSFFPLAAPAGTGKTYLINLLLGYVQMQHKIAIATVTSGIAGTLLHKGITAHSRFKFPIPIFDDSICNIAVNSEKAKVIKNSAIIILDKASMLHHFNIDTLDKFVCVLVGNETILVESYW